MSAALSNTVKHNKGQISNEEDMDFGASAKTSRIDNDVGIPKNPDNPMYCDPRNIDRRDYNECKTCKQDYLKEFSSSESGQSTSLLKNRVNILKSSFQNYPDLPDSSLNEDIVMSDEEISYKAPPPPSWDSSDCQATDKKRLASYHHSLRFLKKNQNRDPNSLNSREKMLTRKHQCIVNKYESVPSHLLPTSSPLLSEKDDQYKRLVTVQHNSHASSPSGLNQSASSTDNIIVISGDEGGVEELDTPPPPCWESQYDMEMKEISDQIPDETKGEKECEMKKAGSAIILNENINETEISKLCDQKLSSSKPSEISPVENVVTPEGQFSTIESINFIVKLSLPPLNMDITSAVLLIKKQNESFSSADWKIIRECKSKEDEGKDLWISVSSESLKLLRHTDGKIRFGINHLQMTLPQENERSKVLKLGDINQPSLPNLEGINIDQPSIKSPAAISSANIIETKISKLDDKESSVTNVPHPEAHTSTTESIKFVVKLSLPHVKVDNRSILLLIKKQNKSFSSADWKIVRDCKSDTGGGKDLWISVSSESLKLLRSTNGKIRFGTNHLQMVLPQENENSTVYNLESSNIVQHFLKSPAVISNSNINKNIISKLDDIKKLSNDTSKTSSVTNVSHSEGHTSTIESINFVVKLSLPPVNMDNRSILLLIKKQNESFSSADWKIIRECKSDEGEGRDLWISISSESLKLLRNTDGKIRFGINHLQMILPQENERSKMSNLEDINIDQSSLKSPAVISKENINEIEISKLDDNKVSSNHRSGTLACVSSVTNIPHPEAHTSTIESINFVVRLSLPPLNMDNRSILLLIKKQNESFSSADWKIIRECKSDEGEGRDLWISVSSDSLKLLRNTDGKIRFGINHLHMILPQENERSTISNLENTNFEHHPLKRFAGISNTNITKTKICKLGDNKESSNDTPEITECKSSITNNVPHPSTTNESLNFVVKPAEHGEDCVAPQTSKDEQKQLSSNSTAQKAPRSYRICIKTKINGKNKRLFFKNNSNNPYS